VQLTLLTHIAAGALGLGSGYVALYAAKGAGLHRRSGLLFVYAMLVMSAGGIVLAIWRDAAPLINIPAAMLTSCLIVTGMTTISPASTRTRRVDFGAMAAAAAVALIMLGFGVATLAGRGPRGGMVAPFFVFGLVSGLAAAGDLRVLRRGAPVGAARVARHLWRMSFALFVAALSFTVQVTKLIPKPWRSPVLLLPMLAVLATMIYWLWRVRGRRALRGLTITTELSRAA